MCSRGLADGSVCVPEGLLMAVCVPEGLLMAVCVPEG